MNTSLRVQPAIHVQASERANIDVILQNPLGVCCRGSEHLTYLKGYVLLSHVHSVVAGIRTVQTSTLPSEQLVGLWKSQLCCVNGKSCYEEESLVIYSSD